LLLKAAYGEDSTGLQSRLNAIAQALNRGDFAAAMIVAVHTRTPELSPEAAMRLANAEQELTKYNYNPDEPRDWRGRWTRDGTAVQANPTAPGIADDQGADAQIFDQRQRVPEAVSLLDATPPSDGEVGDDSQEPKPLQQPFEREPANVAVQDDIMRNIVKNACIAECSESSLPTYNFGWEFFNCVNDCMRRHGYDPFVVRL
jgi:hypothetical protein